MKFFVVHKQWTRLDNLLRKYAPSLFVLANNGTIITKKTKTETKGRRRFLMVYKSYFSTLKHFENCRLDSHLSVRC